MLLNQFMFDEVTNSRGYNHVMISFIDRELN